MALKCLAESDDAPLRAAAATLAAAAAAAAAGTRSSSSSSPTLSSRVTAAQRALFEFASDDPHAGVRRAAMAALVEEVAVAATVEDDDEEEGDNGNNPRSCLEKRRRNPPRRSPSLALGRLQPELASTVARGALSGDCDASVRLQSLRLLLAACREAGACRTSSKASPSFSSPPAAAAAADVAFAAASRSAASDPDARVRAASLALLGRLSAASPRTLEASLTKATTARTMEGVSADDASLIAQEGVGGGGGGGGGAGREGGMTGGGGDGGNGGAAAAGAASAAAAASNPSSPWEAAPGAFVHGLEDDAAAVRECALEALASLSRSLGGERGKGNSSSPSFLARAAAFAAGCSGDEAPAVRAAALRCLRAACLSSTTPLDEHIPAVLSGLRDSAPEVAAAAATGLLTPEPGAPCPLRGSAALRAAVSVLLEAACGRTPASSPSFSSMSDGSAARAAAQAALAALGFAAGARAAPLVAELAPGKGGGGGGGGASKNSNAFVQREPSIDDQVYASRLLFLLAAARASPSVASLLPRHALDAAGVLSARHAALPLPGGGLRSLGRGAVAVVAGGGEGEGVRAKKRARVVERDGSCCETVRAISASLAGAAGSPAEAKARVLRLAEAALSPLARRGGGGGGGSGAAAAARVAVRALAVLSTLQEKATEGGENEEEEVEEEEEEELGGRWDGGGLHPPPLSDCLGAVTSSRSLARRRLERLADVLELGFFDAGVAGKGRAGSRKQRAAFAAEVRAIAAVAAAARDRDRDGGSQDDEISAAVADAEAAASAAGLSHPAWIALSRTDLAAALQMAWPVLLVSFVDDDATCCAVSGELLSPGGEHALPVEAVSSLPLPLAVVARVSSCSSSSKFDEDRPLWLRVSCPWAEVMMLRLRGGGGGGSDPVAAVALAAATFSSSDATVFSSRVELPHPPSDRDCTLTLALVSSLGRRKKNSKKSAAAAAVTVFARLGATRALPLRVVRQQQQPR